MTDIVNDQVSLMMRSRKDKNLTLTIFVLVEIYQKHPILGSFCESCHEPCTISKVFIML